MTNGFCINSGCVPPAKGSSAEQSCGSGSGCFQERKLRWKPFYREVLHCLDAASSNTASCCPWNGRWGCPAGDSVLQKHPIGEKAQWSDLLRPYQAGGSKHRSCCALHCRKSFAFEFNWLCLSLRALCVVVWCSLVWCGVVFPRGVHDTVALRADDGSPRLDDLFPSLHRGMLEAAVAHWPRKLCSRVPSTVEASQYTHLAPCPILEFVVGLSFWLLFYWKYSVENSFGESLFASS